MNVTKGIDLAVTQPMQIDDDYFDFCYKNLKDENWKDLVS